ncbi:MAG: hypothetical protein VYD87_19715 [Pseudomonadota bacterium]|nr:hypothetical protein [Pseudomonadota bacterium]MEE3101607.1 hypothetical protein [Pseudomonadota bacterium]
MTDDEPILPEEPRLVGSDEMFSVRRTLTPPDGTSSEAGRPFRQTLELRLVWIDEMFRRRD